MTTTVRTPWMVTIGLLLALVLTHAPLAQGAAYKVPEADSADLGFYRPPITTELHPLTDADRVKNVILCIGDGMGLSQVALTSSKAVGRKGRLHMERLPISGLVRTWSANSAVTDSAAASTAMACGVKTNNGMIGMTPDGQRYHTILEAAQARGMATGLVATAAITHATPAAFASHVKSRKMEDRIAEHLIGNRVNVLFGGGRRFFLPGSDPNSGREDEIDLITAAREAGYAYVETACDLRSSGDDRILGLFQLGALTTVEPEPSLATLTEKAIETLHRVNHRPDTEGPGFFLMVEGSQIDWACHNHDTAATIRQTLLFDQAVEAAVDFALKDGHTLVIVTADHETGGLTLFDNDNGEADLVPRWSTKGHSCSPVPIWAVGPGALRFAGVQDNTDVPRKIARMLDIKPFPRLVK